MNQLGGLIRSLQRNHTGPTRTPHWAADGGNGRVVDMDSSTMATARHLYNLMVPEVDLLCPNVPAWVLETVMVQFVATLTDLESKA